MALGCLISSFYIKPQHWSLLLFRVQGCLISSFYIKPQPSDTEIYEGVVVLYLHSTSNHNEKDDMVELKQLSYIFILHQTTTYIMYIFVIQYIRQNNIYMKWQMRFILLQKY